MKILIIGANGKIGKHLLSQLKNSEHEVRAMVRDRGQGPEMERLGADEWVYADLEEDITDAVKGCDAVVFTAGSGGHTGPDKTELVDNKGAKKSVDTSVSEGIRRYIMVSSRHADDPENGNPKIQHYYRAKGEADEHLRASGLNYTILRPGKLTLEQGTGKIAAAEHLQDRSGSIPREDVARTVIEALENSHTFRKSIDIVSGQLTIREALQSL